MMDSAAGNEELSRRTWLERHGLEALRVMTLIRDIEMRLPGYVRAGYIAGSTHQSVGMEAVAVGVSITLRPADVIVSTHRGHAHFLAKGGSVHDYLAELFGRSTGACGGRGGSMLLADIKTGILATDAIVGEGIGIATGAALAFSLRGSGEVSVCYFGDGALNQGIFYEALNLASVWRLPCVFICENNHYAKSCHERQVIAAADLTSLAGGRGIPTAAVDGMDAFSVWEAAESAVADARSGRGPAFIVADTYRFCGHSVGDTEIYRPEEEVDAWRGRDPLPRLETELAGAGLADERSLAMMRLDVKQILDTAETSALSAPAPDPASAAAHVYSQERQHWSR
jgi:acetoin:2,6-dichlorophenolindophenol oxidoreductase subunit alpha